MRGAAKLLAALALLAAVIMPGSAAAPASAPIAFRWLRMIDAMHGYALSGVDPDAYRLLWTADGGRRWHDVTPGRGTIHPSGPLTVAGRTRLFSTKLRNRVFAVARSDDGGHRWRRSLPFRDPRGLGVGQPFMVDERHLYLAVDEGAAAGSQAQALYTSNDGGHSWRFVSRTDFEGRDPQALPFGCDKRGFGFSTPLLGWAGGYCAGGRPFFYRTDDGGRTWRRQALAAPAACGCDTSPPRFFTRRLAALSVIGFVENGSGRPFVRVFWTNDGGRHWRASAPRAGRTSGVTFADARTVWVIAQRPGNLGARFDRLFLTTDTGRHWRTVKLPFDAEYYQLDALSATSAFAFRVTDQANTIVVTHDGGRTWRTVRPVE